MSNPADRINDLIDKVCGTYTIAEPDAEVVISGHRYSNNPAKQYARVDVAVSPGTLGDDSGTVIVAVDLPFPGWASCEPHIHLVSDALDLTQGALFISAFSRALAIAEALAPLLTAANTFDSELVGGQQPR